MRIELSSLNSEPSTPSNETLKRAAAKLCFTEYEHFKAALIRGIADYELKDLIDSESSSVIGEQVCSKRHPDAPPRKFLTGSSKRCDCKPRVAHKRPCVHEVLRHGFDEKLFQQMHFRRCRVTGSLNGWTVPSETAALAD